MKPDFMVYTRGNDLVLVVEVKAPKNESEQWAATLRRNLLAHGAVPDSPFFLLVLPEHVYLWKNSPGIPEVAPTFVARTKDLLDPYLPTLDYDYSRLSESSLELAVRSWLTDVTNPSHREQTGEIQNRLLVDSGLASQIRHGALLYGDAA